MLIVHRLSRISPPTVFNEQMVASMLATARLMPRDDEAALAEGGMREDLELLWEFGNIVKRG